MTGQAATGLGDSTYTAETRDTRSTFKLTWSPTPDHTLVSSLITQDKDQVVGPTAGDLSSLILRQEQARLLSLQLRSTIGAHWSLSAKMGLKRWKVKVKGVEEVETPTIIN